ncbi:MAG: hypothetical protein IH942_00420 [Acidobacteria bacterium]|nr:hypothetical protein [Acidobacteriota bacterium]
MEERVRWIPEDLDVQTLVLEFELLEAGERMPIGDGVNADKQRHRRLVKKVLRFRVSDQ